MSNRQVADSKPSLRVLSVVLRNRELWPEGFVFGFTDQCTCAMGLAHRLWGAEDGVCDMFLIGLVTAQNLFQHGAYHPVADASVTPEMIADRIDAHLAAA